MGLNIGSLSTDGVVGPNVTTDSLEVTDRPRYWLNR